MGWLGTYPMTPCDPTITTRLLDWDGRLKDAETNRLTEALAFSASAKHDAWRIFVTGSGPYLCKAYTGIWSHRSRGAQLDRLGSHWHISRHSMILLFSVSFPVPVLVHIHVSISVRRPQFPCTRHRAAGIHAFEWRCVCMLRACGGLPGL